MGNTPIVGLVVEVSAGREHVEIVVAGDLDMVSNGTLHRHVDEIDPRMRIVLDLGGVTFMDSSGLHCLWSISDRVRSFGGSLVLRAPSDAVMRILKAMHLEDAFVVDAR